jgi:hypothetical protein
MRMSLVFSLTIHSKYFRIDIKKALAIYLIARAFLLVNRYYINYLSASNGDGCIAAI